MELFVSALVESVAGHIRGQLVNKHLGVNK